MTDVAPLPPKVNHEYIRGGKSDVRDWLVVSQESNESSSFAPVFVVVVLDDPNSQNASHFSPSSFSPIVNRWIKESILKVRSLSL